MNTRRPLVLAQVLEVHGTRVAYPCCGNCFSKLRRDTSSGRFCCLKCGSSYPSDQVPYRYRLGFTITDGLTESAISVFGRNLDPFFGASANEFVQYVQDAERCSSVCMDELLNQSFSQAFLGQMFVFGFKTKKPVRTDPINGECVSLKTVADCSLLHKLGSESDTAGLKDCGQTLIAWQMIQANFNQQIQSVLKILKTLVSRSEKAADLSLRAETDNSMDDSLFALCQNGNDSLQVSTRSFCHQRSLILSCEERNRSHSRVFLATRENSLLDNPADASIERFRADVSSSETDLTKPCFNCDDDSRCFDDKVDESDIIDAQLIGSQNMTFPAPTRPVPKDICCAEDSVHISDLDFDETVDIGNNLQSLMLENIQTANLEHTSEEKPSSPHSIDTNMAPNRDSVSDSSRSDAACSGGPNQLSLECTFTALDGTNIMNHYRKAICDTQEMFQLCDNLEDEEEDFSSNSDDSSLLLELGIQNAEHGSMELDSTGEPAGILKTEGDEEVKAASEEVEKVQQPAAIFGDSNDCFDAWSEFPESEDLSAFLLLAAGAQLEHCQDEQDTAEKKSNSCQDQQDTAEKKNDSCQDQQDTAEKKSNSCQDQQDTAEKKNDSCQDQQDTAEKKNDSCQDQQDTMGKKNDSCQDQQDTMERKNDSCQDQQDTVERKNDSCQDQQDTMERKNDSCQDQQDTTKKESDSCDKDKLLSKAAKTDSANLNSEPQEASLSPKVIHSEIIPKAPSTCSPKAEEEKATVRLCYEDEEYFPESEDLDAFLQQLSDSWSQEPMTVESVDQAAKEIRERSQLAEAVCPEELDVPCNGTVEGESRSFQLSAQAVIKDKGVNKEITQTSESDAAIRREGSFDNRAESHSAFGVQSKPNSKRGVSLSQIFEKEVNILEPPLQCDTNENTLSPSRRSLKDSLQLSPSGLSRSPTKFNLRQFAKASAEDSPSAARAEQADDPISECMEGSADLFDVDDDMLTLSNLSLGASNDSIESEGSDNVFADSEEPEGVIKRPLVQIRRITHVSDSASSLRSIPVFGDTDTYDPAKYSERRTSVWFAPRLSTVEDISNIDFKMLSTPSPELAKLSKRRRSCLKRRTSGVNVDKGLIPSMSHAQDVESQDLFCSPVVATSPQHQLQTEYRPETKGRARHYQSTPVGVRGDFGVAGTVNDKGDSNHDNDCSLNQIADSFDEDSVVPPSCPSIRTLKSPVSRTLPGASPMTRMDSPDLFGDSRESVREDASNSRILSDSDVIPSSPLADRKHGLFLSVHSVLDRSRNTLIRRGRQTVDQDNSSQDLFGDD